MLRTAFLRFRHCQRERLFHEGVKKSSGVMLGEDAIIPLLTTVHEKRLDFRSPAFAEDKFRGNDRLGVNPAKAGDPLMMSRPIFHSSEESLQFR